MADDDSWTVMLVNMVPWLLVLTVGYFAFFRNRTTVKWVKKRKGKEESADKPNMSSRYLLIVIIIGFVMAIVFGMRTGVPESAPTQVQSGHPALSATAMAWVPWILLLFIFYFIILRNLISQTDANANNDAIALQNAGRLAEAGKIYDEIIQKTRKKSKLAHSVFLLNRARLHIELHRFDEANDALDKLSKTSGLQQDFPVLILKAQAESQAIAGDLSKAEEYCHNGTELLSIPRQGLMALAQTLIQLRRGAFKVAAEMPDADWFAAEAMLGTDGMRRLRVLRAFALKNLPPTPQAQEQMQMLVAGARPFHPGEFDYLAAKWPELKAFLVEQGLTSPTT